MSKPLWLIEAQRHIGLKEIKGAKHNNLIILWLKALRAWWMDDETPWCFTGETEILTEDGWQRFDGLAAQRVYQADSSGALSLTGYKPVIKPYNGDVFTLSHRAIKVTCDVGHRWWGRWGKSENLKFGTLDALGANGLSIPSVFSAEGGVSLTDDQICLLAAFISDGKYRYCGNGGGRTPKSIEFEVSRQRKIYELTRLKPDHVYTQSKVYGPLTKKPLTVFRFSMPSWFAGCFSEYKQLSPEFIRKLSQNQAQVFLRAYALFDGNNSPSAIRLYTSDRKILDSLMTIAVLAGYHPSVQARGQSELSGRDAFALVFSPQKTMRHLRAGHVTRSAYQGLLYCVSVPEGRIVIRGQSGGPIVVGNCGTYVAHCIKACKLQLPKYWMRALDWLNWGQELARPSVGCVVVFERTGGGHVGFVVGKDAAGNLMVLGGNQGDAVKISPFDPVRVLGYRWPSQCAKPVDYHLPTIASNGQLSKNEA